MGGKGLFKKFKSSNKQDKKLSDEERRLKPIKIDKNKKEKSTTKNKSSIRKKVTIKEQIAKITLKKKIIFAVLALMLVIACAIVAKMNKTETEQSSIAGVSSKENKGTVSMVGYGDSATIYVDGYHVYCLNHGAYMYSGTTVTANSNGRNWLKSRYGNQLLYVLDNGYSQNIIWNAISGTRYTDSNSYQPENVTITKSNAKTKVTSTDILIGPFSINNDGNYPITYNATIKVGDKSYTTYIVDSSGNKKNSTTFTGEFYLKANTSAAYNKNVTIKANISATYNYNNITIYTPNISGYQNLVRITPNKKSTSASYEYKQVVSKPYKIKVKKTLSSQNNNLTMNAVFGIYEGTSTEFSNSQKKGECTIKNTNSSYTTVLNGSINPGQTKYVWVKELSVTGTEITNYYATGQGSYAVIQVTCDNSGKVTYSLLTKLEDGCAISSNNGSDCINVQFKDEVEEWPGGGGFDLILKKRDTDLEVVEGAKFNVKVTKQHMNTNTYRIESTTSERTYTSDSSGLVCSLNYDEEYGFAETFNYYAARSAGAVEKLTWTIDITETQAPSGYLTYFDNNTSLRIYIELEAEIVNGEYVMKVDKVRQAIYTNNNVFFNNEVPNNRTFYLDNQGDEYGDDAIETNKYAVNPDISCWINRKNDTITIDYKNIEIWGNYNFSVNKKDKDTGELISGAVIRYLYKNDENGKISDQQEYITNTSSTEKLFSNVRISTTDSDYIYVKELSAPEGYKKIVDGYFRLELKKRYNSNINRCVVSSITVAYSETGETGSYKEFYTITDSGTYSININNSTGELFISKGEDIATNTVAQIAIDNYANRNIDFTFCNPPKTGEYQISVNKLSDPTDENSKLEGAAITAISNNDNLTEAVTTTFETNADMNMFLNKAGDWSPHTNTNNDLAETIDIKTSTDNDIYRFKEDSPPEGYQKNVYQGYVTLRINKDENDTNYIIGSIDILQESTPIYVMDKTETIYILCQNGDLFTKDNISEEDYSTLVGKIEFDYTDANIKFSFFNRPIEGKYDISLLKKDVDNNEELTGANIDYKYKNDNSSGKTISGTVELSNYNDSKKYYLDAKNEIWRNALNYSSDFDSDIPSEHGVNITNKSVSDQYKFKESSAPTGYKISYAGEITVDVYKTQKEGSYIYEIDYIKITTEEGNSYEISLNNDNRAKYCYIKADGTFTTEKTDDSIAYISLADTDEQGKTEIEFVFYDEPIEGGYSMSIKKKSTKDESELSDNSTIIGDATFTVEQYKDVSSSDISSIIRDEDVNPTAIGTATTVNKQEGIVYFNGNSNIDINFAEYGNSQYTFNWDLYKITEINVPKGYKNVDLSDLLIGVEKSFDIHTDEFKIERISIYDNMWKSILDSSQHSNKVTLPNGTEVGFELNEDNTAFAVTIYNPPIEGEYNLSLIKKDKNDNKIIPGAKVSYEYDTDETNKTTGTATTQENPIYLNTSNNTWSQSSSAIKITDEDAEDIYKFTETSAPEDYKINYTGSISLEVRKTVQKTGDDEKYIINSILVSTDNGSGELKSNTGKEYYCYILKDGQVHFNCDEAFINSHKDEFAAYISLNNEGTNIKIEFYDDEKDGTYNVQLTKKDTSGKVIEDENTQFKINVYKTATENNGTVTFSDQIETLKINNNDVNVKDKTLNATTGVTTELNNIQIQHEDIGKTYYFVIEETVPPDQYTAIDYKVVLPISYTTNNDGIYIATKQDTYAITSDNTKKTLQEAASSTTAVVSTEQTGVTINVNVPNKSLTGEYDLIIKKVDEKNNPVSGVTFKLTGDINNTYTTVSGSTRTIYNYITDISKDDTITITEQKSDGMIGLKNSITLKVSKDYDTGDKNTAKSYIVTGVKAYESDESGNKIDGKNEYSINNTTGTVTIKNAELTDGTTVNLELNLGDGSSSNQTIQLTVKNKNEKSYKIKLLKVALDTINDEDGNYQTIEGRYFNVYKADSRLEIKDENLIVKDAKTDENGEITIGQFDLNTSGYDYFIIKETYPNGDDGDGYIKMENYVWCLTIAKVLGNSGYEISNPILRYKCVGTSNSIEQQIAFRSKVRKSDDYTVEIVISNWKKDFSFDLKKVKTDGNSLAGSKFTINATIDSGGVLKNITCDPNEEDTPEISTQNILPNSKVTITITENNAPEGYINLFKVYENVVGNLTVNIYFDENGNIDQSKTELQWNNPVDNYKEIIQDYLNNTKKDSIIEYNGNSVTLNLPNEKQTTSYNFSLNKHSYGDEDYKIEAQFTTKKYAVSSGTKFASADELSNKIDSEGKDLEGFTTNTNTDSTIDNEQSAHLNYDYYYKITETNTNRTITIESAIVKIATDNSGNTSCEIVAIKLKGQSSYISWTGYINSNGTYKDRISITPNGNSYTINWANDTPYALVLFKKGYEGEITENTNLEGKENVNATFNVTAAEIVSKYENGNVIETENTILTETGIHLDAKSLVNNNAKINTTYRYTLEETSSGETTQSGKTCVNIFKDIKIILDVKVDEDGNIDEDNISVNFEGTNNYDYYKKYIKVEANNNLVYVYIVNPIEKETTNIKILKKSSSTSNPIPGVTFNVMGPGNIALDPTTTNSEGIATIPDVDLGSRLNYVFTETSVPVGVTLLENTNITLTIDAVNKASELTNDKLHLSVNSTGAGGVTEIEGLKVYLSGNDIIIEIPNESKYMDFGVYKYDEYGNLIQGAVIDENGNAKMVELEIQKYENNSYKTLESIKAVQGYLSVPRQNIIGNSEYIYAVKEKSSKPGYLNVFKGYTIYVHIRTDAQANIIDFAENPFINNNTNSYIEIKETASTHWYKANNEKITPEDLQKYISYEITTNESTNQAVVKINLENPTAARVKLIKQDISGNEIKNVAQISAYCTSYSEDASILTLQPTNSSAIMINSNRYIMVEEGATQEWKVKENFAYTPYENILKDKTLYVTTRFENNELKVQSFEVRDDNSQAYSNLAKYVDVSTQQIDGIWTLVVEIKDPIEVKAKLLKVDADGSALKGANLTLTTQRPTSESVNTNGASETDYITSEVATGSILTYVVTEESTVEGHTNILEGKSLYLIYRINEQRQLVLSQSFVIANGEQHGPGSEIYEEVMKYVTITNENREINITLKNPITYKFKLYKQNTAKENITGAEIYVNSSASGDHYLNENSGMEFVEEVNNETYVDYTIQELYSPNGAYVNQLQDCTLYFYTEMSEKGELTVTGYHLIKTYYDSSQPNAVLTQTLVEKSDNTETGNLEDYGIRYEITKEDGLQTIVLYIENKTSFNFELTKTQDGQNANNLSGTIFDVISTSGTELTNKATSRDGKITFSESGIDNGDYTIKVYEKQTATTKYVNILGDNYIEVNINVSAEGDVTFKDSSSPYKVLQPNGTQITDVTQRAFYEKYIDVTIDTTSKPNTVKVQIKNPVKITLELYKQSTAGTDLEDAEFAIYSQIANKTITQKTDSNGNITVEENIVTPGIYRYTITELESPSTTYTNIFEGGYKIVFYVKVDNDGYVTLVADQNGKEFNSSTVNKFYIYDPSNNNITDSEKGIEIAKYISLHENNNYDVGTITLIVENPNNYYVDLIKQDTEEGNLNGARFTVYRGTTCIYDKGEVTQEAIEMHETGLSEGVYTYYITEDYIAHGKYVNTLEGKYIKVNVRIRDNGVVQIVNDEDDRDDDYFEVYEGSVSSNGQGTLIDRSDKIYNGITVGVTQNSDGEYIVQVKVENPTKYIFRLTKLNAGSGILSGAKFTAYMEDSDGNVQTLLDNEPISDKIMSFTPVEAGDYIFYITETEAASSKYTNILEGKFLKIYLTVKGDGTIYTTDKNHNASANYYEIYEGDISTRTGTQITSITELARLNEFIDIHYTSNANVSNTLYVYINNPTYYELNLIKKDTSNNEITGANFVVRKYNSETQQIETIYDGEATQEIELTEKEMVAGDYTYYVTETSAPGGQYNNILEGKYIRIWVNLSADGTLTTRYARALLYEGDIYNPTDQDQNLGSAIDGEYVDVNITQNSNGTYKLNIEVINPVKYQLDIVKTDSAGNTLDNCAFVVLRDNTIVMSGGYASENIEVTEQNMQAGDYEAYITEVATKDYNRYVNILAGKFVKIYFRLQPDGTVKILNNQGNEQAGYFEIYKGTLETTGPAGNAQKLSTSDEAYDFVSIPNVQVNSDGINVIKVEVENPTLYYMGVRKRDASNMPIGDSKFTVLRQDPDGTITQIMVNGDANQAVLQSPMKAGNYIYYVTETRTPGVRFVNILEDKYVKVYITVEADGDIYITNSKYQASDGYYELYEGNIDSQDGTKIDNNEFISTEVGHNMSGTNILYVNVINPVEYYVDIIKTTTAENEEDKLELNDAEFTAVRENVSTGETTQIVNGKLTSDPESNEKPMLAGNYIYYFTETATAGPQYNNILENKYIKIYITVSADGVVTLMDNTFTNASEGYYEVYEGNINNRKDTDTLVTTNDEHIAVSISNYNDWYYKIDVNVENPVQYKFTINKKIFGEEQVNLQGVTMFVRSSKSGDHANLITDKDGNISFIEEYVGAGRYTYLVTETATAGDEFINILENKGILITVYVNGDGSLQLENYTFVDITDIDNPVELEDSGIISDLVFVDTSTKDDIAQIDVAIQNPQKYDFSLVKIDKDTKEAMNNVPFTVTVEKSNGEEFEEIEIKDANTFESIQTDELVTANVDGVDGVISINDILIESTGTYRFILHEESTDGIFDILYKTHRYDVIIEATIVVRNGIYVMEDIQVVSGANYITFLDFSTGIATGETNERIKGKYDLELEKIDSYTGEYLDGAVFDVTVERDGQESELYKSTDDVTSKDVIIPTTVTVTDGKIKIEDIRIERPETYTIILTETKAPEGYMLLEVPIKLKVTTNRNGVENYDDEKFIIESVELIEDQNHGLISLEYNEDEIKVKAKNEYFDLALRKSITSVSYEDGTEDGIITEEETADRIPDVETGDLMAEYDTTAIYNHNKTPVRVYAGQYVIYTLRVYNEGEIDGYAEEITDHLPEWLEFVDDEFNSERGWKLDESDPSNKTVKTDYLSEANGTVAEDGVNTNLLKARNRYTGELDYREIQIKCKVVDTAKAKTIITNIAEISLSKADRTSETVDRDSVTNNIKLPETSEEWSEYKNDELTKSYVPGQEDDDDFEKLIVEVFDLSLRKYITSVNGEDLLADSESDLTYEREPNITLDGLNDGSSTTARYNHPKDPVEVCVDDTVTYTIAVYNEGTVSGYATLIKDDIPDGLEFIVDSELNKEYRWVLLDENEQVTDDVTKAEYIMTDYLSRANGEDNILKAYDGKTLDTKYVRVDFKVVLDEKSSEIVENKAEISEDEDESGKDVKDRDSTPNEWIDHEDDQDIERIRILYFDLALRKWVTQAIVTQNGQTTVTETGHKAEDDPEEVVKVDLKKSSIKDVVVKFKYSIRVTNEGRIAGYAKEVKDRIPDGLVFNQADNPNWVEIEEGIVTTDALANTLLQPGESAEVEIILTWVNSATNMGVKVNVAEISKDENDYGAPDIDSTPDNNVLGEDDIDDAPVMLTVKTGSNDFRNVLIALGVLAILGFAVSIIKENNRKN